MVRRARSDATTLVLFVRHGRTSTTGTILPGRTKSLHLSEEGKADAQALADHLQRTVKRIDAIYASPLERCKETATPISQAYGQSLHAHRGLLECDFGEWTGEKLSRLSKLPEWQVVQRSPSTFRFPGGESFLEMQARIGDAISRLVELHPGQTIAVVSHADPIKAAVASALGTPLDLFQRITISPCSVSVIRYGAEAPAVLAVNAVQELGELQPS